MVYMKSKKQKVPFAKVLIDLRVLSRYAIDNKELEDDIIKYLKTVNWTTDEYLRECSAAAAKERMNSSSVIMNTNPKYLTKIGSYLDIN